jgi:hypothetical protein
MWNWVGANAIALNAINSVALVGLTAALVALTGVLAWVGIAQVRFQREVSRRRRGQLRNDIHFLGTVLQALPGPTSNHDDLTLALRRDAIISWDDFSFDRFRMGAAELSPVAGSVASTIEWAMKRLSDRIKSIQAVKSPADFDWSKFDWLVWNNSLDQAREALQKIENELGSGFPSQAEIAKLLFRA